MIGRDNVGADPPEYEAVVAFEHPAWAKEPLQRRGANSDDDPRRDDPELRVEERRACRDLLGGRGPIDGRLAGDGPGGPAQHGVGDECVCARKSDLPEEGIEDPARAANERAAELVLVSPRRLAKEQ